MRAIAPGLLLLGSILSKPAIPQTTEELIQQHFRNGQQALRQSNFAQAADDFKRVLALDPTLVEAEVNLGLAYQGLLDYNSAIRYLTKALKERPNLPGPSLIVGLDYIKLSSPEKAIPFLEQTVKFDPSNSYAREALASCYLNRENFRSAAEQYRQIALLTLDKAEAWFKLGHQYLDLASRLAYRGARLHPESAWGHRFLGDLLFQRERWQDAVKEYQKALAGEPRQSGLHTSLGQAYLRDRKPEQAEREFRLALNLDPHDELAWLGLANWYLGANHPKGAIESLDQIWQRSPEFLALPREFPSIELTREQARALLLAVEAEPEGAQKQYLLSALYSADGNTGGADRAWKSFQAAVSVRIQAANAEAASAKEDPCQSRLFSRCISFLQAQKSLTVPQRLLLGRTQFTLQQFEPSASTLELMPETAAENAEASYWLERSYQALGAETYARLEESFPSSWRTHQLRAEGAALRASRDEAVKEFRAALELNPTEPELHDSFGEFYLENHEYEEAEAEFEKALALDPSRAHTLYLLGRVYVEGKENEKAVPYLERAVQLQPDVTEANSLLGTAYMRLGEFAKAVPKLEKAAATDHYGNVHYQLYMAYRKLGKTELAEKELARSRELRSNALERDQAVIMGTPQPPVTDQQ